MSQKYSKDSFDRFGDDLYEDLLSYLSLEDCIRCECLSKQCQRLVYNSQSYFVSDWRLRNKLTISITKDLTPVETLLKKCPNIRYIDFYMNNEIIDLIVKHCDRLNDINLRISPELSAEKVDKLFAKFAKHLKTCRLESDNKLIDTKALLKLCVNLNVLNSHHFRDISDLFDTNNDVLFPKLTKFETNYGPSVSPRFMDLFVANYRHSMKSIDVTINSNCDVKSYFTLINGLSQMGALVELQLIYYYVDEELIELMAQSMQQIALKLPQLKSIKLYFVLTADEIVLNEIKQTIRTYFKRLKRLDISGYFSDSLSECKRLTHLTINSWDRKTNDEYLLLVNINESHPKLLYLSLNHALITNSVLNSLATLRKIQTIEFNDCEFKLGSTVTQTMTKDYVKSYLNNAKTIIKQNF